MSLKKNSININLLRLQKLQLRQNNIIFKLFLFYCASHFSMAVYPNHSAYVSVQNGNKKKMEDGNKEDLATGFSSSQFRFVLKA